MKKSSGYLPAERHKRIQDIIRENGTLRVNLLSELLKVSELTIRRDLEHLEREGILERMHGGAIYTPHIRNEPLFTEKDRINQEEKRAIGAAAAELVEDGDTLFINSGSTTLQIFHHLAGKKNLRVITSNVRATSETWGLDIELILIGGTYREQSNSMVGPLSIMALHQFNATKCFIGVDGVSKKYGFTTPVLQEAEVARVMIDRTREKRIVVADHSKLGKVADVVTAPIEKIDILVMDHGFDEDFRGGLEETGLEIVVSPDPDHKE